MSEEKKTKEEILKDVMNILVEKAKKHDNKISFAEVGEPLEKVDLDKKDVEYFYDELISKGIELVE